MRSLVLASLLLGVSAPTHAVEVLNFKSGLACMGSPTSKDDGWVCHETQDVLVTDQGRCVYDGETLPCTWIGFEFDYEGAGTGTRLQCTEETSEPTSSGNPDKELATHASSQQFELPLEGASGHYFNPMYWIFATRPGADDITVSYTCQGNGAVLFQAKFNVHFPAGRAATKQDGS
jgi:hypothetical protein